MRFTSDLFRHQYENDIRESAYSENKKWYDWCVDIENIINIENEFVKLVFHSDVKKISLDDFNKLIRYLRCCIRFFPNAPKIIARLPSVLFIFEDSLIS